MNEALFELVFMMVILKLPIVYLCAVVWWAVRAEPRPLEGAARPVAPAAGPCPWRHRGARRGPHGSQGSVRALRPAPRARPRAAR